MGTSFIITFRETLEMVLIIVPLLIYLKKINQLSLSKYVFGGIFAGLISSCGIGAILYTMIESFPVNLQEIFIGFLALVLSGLILYNIVIINKQKSSADPDTFKNSIKVSTLFLLSFITIFRECLEIILFTLPSLMGSLTNSIIGGLLGILVTLIVAYVIYKTSIKVNINVIFAIITIVLIYFGALLFGEALVTFLPQYGDSVEKVGMLIYGVPTGLIYIKKLLKKVQNKLF